MGELEEILLEEGNFVDSKRLSYARYEMEFRIGVIVSDYAKFGDLYSLGTKAIELGNLVFAEQMLRECVEIARFKNHPDYVAISLSALSNCLLKLGKDDEASNTFRDSLKFYELAELSQEFCHCKLQWNFSEFVSLYRRLFSDNDHISVARLLHCHAEKMWEEGDLQKAEQDYRDLSETRRMILRSRLRYSS